MSFSEIDISGIDYLQQGIHPYFSKQRRPSTALEKMTTNSCLSMHESQDGLSDSKSLDSDFEMIANTQSHPALVSTDFSIAKDRPNNLKLFAPARTVFMSSGALNIAIRVV